MHKILIFFCTVHKIMAPNQHGTERNDVDDGTAVKTQLKIPVIISAYPNTISLFKISSTA